MNDEKPSAEKCECPGRGRAGARPPRVGIRPVPGLVLALLGFAGCNSYTIVQSNQFMDEDGAVMTVDYGRAEKDHVNTFRSPANGQELEFPSRLVVDVTLPDGESFSAWQTMNFSGKGTLYRTDDGEWVVLAVGFVCRVARRDGTAPTGYREVFGGVLCNTPVKAKEKDMRWYRIREPEKRAEP